MVENQFRKESKEANKKLDVKKMVDEAKLHFKELRFDRKQVLVSIAIFIRKASEAEDEY